MHRKQFDRNPHFGCGGLFVIRCVPGENVRRNDMVGSLQGYGSIMLPYDRGHVLKIVKDSESAWTY
jgi:hypothetical protein